MTEVGTPMTDFQFRSIIKMIRKIVADKAASGASDEEVLAFLDDLLDEHGIPKKGKITYINEKDSPNDA